jgi:hypothetical protein
MVHYSDYLNVFGSKYKKTAKCFLALGIAMGTILPPMIYQQQLDEMARQEEQIMTDIEKMERQGRRFNEIPGYGK